MTPDVSVVIPCRNAAAFIGDTVRSVLAQRRPSLEIILVDDGSTDGSCAIVRELAPETKIVLTEMRGAGAARNTGTAIAAGRYLQYLDADDLLARGKLERQIAELRTGADVAYGDWERLERDAKACWHATGVVSPHIQDPEIDLFTDVWCPPAAYLFTREVVARAGGWNTGLAVIQDARFALDCAIAGARFVRCAGLMASYRAHAAGSLSTSNPPAFTRDCLRNALEIEEIWRRDGPLSVRRRDALITVLGHIARASHSADPPTFKVAFHALRRLESRYIPREPRRMRLMSRLVGYRNAETLAAAYRRLKGLARHGRYPALRSGER